MNDKKQAIVHALKDRFSTYVRSLRDVRNLSLAIFVGMVLLVTYSSARAIQTNYALQKQLEQLRQENEVTKLENANIKLRNQYYNTPQYLDVAARQNLGLAAPGETVLLVPKESALKNTVPMPNQTKSTTSAKDLPFWQQNLRDWTNFFLHRG